MDSILSGWRDFSFCTFVENLAQRIKDAKRKGIRSIEAMPIPSHEYSPRFLGLWPSLSGFSGTIFRYCKSRGFKPRVVRISRSRVRKIVIRW